MKKVAIAVLAVSFLALIWNYAQAQQWATPQTGFAQSLSTIEKRIASFDEKMNTIIANQEKILEQIDILKIRIRRS